MGKRDVELRFGVGAPGLGFSSLWRLWIPRGTSDVYLANRSVAGDVKVSMHGSGWCHLGYTSQSAARRGISPEHRTWDRWRGPTFDDGLTVPLVVVVPVYSLTAALAREGMPTKPLVWLAPQSGKEAAEITFAFMNRPLPPGVWPGNAEDFPTVPLLNRPLPNGQTFWMVAYERDLPDHFKKAVNDATPRAREMMKGVDLSEVDDMEKVRGFIWGHFDDGKRYICEVPGKELVG